MPLYRPKLRRKVTAGIVTGASAVVANANLGAVASLVSAPGTGFLRMGVAGSPNIGIGPGELVAPNPTWRVIGPYTPTASTIDADIAAALANDVHLAWNFAGSRNFWAPNQIFDMSLWISKANNFIGNANVRSFLASRQGSLMAIDEANRLAGGFDDGTGHSTVTPRDCNDMGLYLKAHYGNPIVYLRMGSDTLANGWPNIGVNGAQNCPPSSYVSAITGRTEQGWSGIDYGYSQFAFQNQLETPSTYFNRERAQMATLNLGMIPGVNYFDGGSSTVVVDGIPACWQYQYPALGQGVIVGTRGDSVTPDGTPLVCSSPLIGTNTATRYVVPSPALLRRVAAVISLDTLAPWFTGFTYADPSNAIIKQWQVDLQRRPDMVSALQDMIASGNSRTQFDGWRAAKTAPQQ